MLLYLYINYVILIRQSEFLKRDPSTYATSFLSRCVKPSPVHDTISRCDSTVPITVQTGPKVQTAR